MSSYINMKSRRSFTFDAPYSEEGERVVRIPFPVAVKRNLEEGRIVHECNPQLVTISPASEETITVETKVQPGSLLIVRNEGSAKATLGNVECENGGVYTLLFDGNSYGEVCSTII